MDIEGLNSVIEEAARGTIDTRNGRLDAAMVSFEYTDHIHKATLLQINTDVLIIASTKPARIIKSWEHFSSVVEIPIFSGDKWNEAVIDKSPEWLKIEKIYDPKIDNNPFHSVFLIIYSCEKVGEQAEALIYKPHGIEAVYLRSINKTQPHICPIT